MSCAVSQVAEGVLAGSLATTGLMGRCRLLVICLAKVNILEN